MNNKYELATIIEESKNKGYFDPQDYPKIRFKPQELLELMEALRKKKIPYGNPSNENPLTKKEANEIIDALRKGIPSQEGVSYYSVGQEKILNEVRNDLSSVANKNSIVRFLNANIGEGKTHTLYRLQELAYKQDFVVSIVTLSQSFCPLDDFMAVFNGIMWGLRTSDQRIKPAISNIFDRWVTKIRQYDKPRIREIVRELPPNIKEIMAAYEDAKNIIRPNEIKRQNIINFFGGNKVSKREANQLGINFVIDSNNALLLLSELAIAIRCIGYKGICILFDEAESIHSFAISSKRISAYENLQRISKQSQSFSHCYFLYATTPSFVESYDLSWIDHFSTKPFLELLPLNKGEKQEIGVKVTDIYEKATQWEIPGNVKRAIEITSEETISIGNFVRKVVGIMDEARQLNVR